MYFYSKMIFYTWRHYSNLTFDKLYLQEKENKLYVESDDSDEEKKFIQEKMPKNPNTSLNKFPNILEIFEKPIQNIVSPLMGTPNIIVTKTNLIKFSILFISIKYSKYKIVKFL